MTWRDLVQRLRSSALFGLGAPRPLPSAPSGVTRRQFLKVAGIAAATIALLPETLALDEPFVLEAPVVGISLAEIDAILKDIYLPAIVEMLNAENSMLKFMGRGAAARSFVVPLNVKARQKHDYELGANYYDTEEADD